jgi:hypothetical protein
MILGALALALSTAAGADARVDAVALSTASGAVRVAGELTAEVWDSVPPTAGFMQREPTDGAAPSQRTEFRVAYDASTMFVKVRAFDNDADRIVTYLTRRFGFPVRLDPHPDRLVPRQADRLRVRRQPVRR